MRQRSRHRVLHVSEHLDYHLCYKTLTGFYIQLCIFHVLFKLKLSMKSVWVSFADSLVVSVFSAQEHLEAALSGSHYSPSESV